MINENGKNLPFKFAVLGAGGVAGKFCNAVELVPNCMVAAVGSKSLHRGQAFAEKNNIPKAYGDYKTMLETEKPDCAYIATTTDSHYDLSMLCLELDIPVLCEKAMVMNSMQAKKIFDLAKQKNLFVMEAMWSRFLPPVQKAREWVKSGLIGNIGFIDAGLGFTAQCDSSNRYYSKALGGGACFDLLVYAFEIADYFTPSDIPDIKASVIWSGSGIDKTEQVTLQYPSMIASLKASFGCMMEERMVICGDKGRIIIPKPHVCSEAFLYDESQKCVQHFKDETTQQGFTYQIEETISCILSGKTQSDTVPHSLTLKCSEIFDRIWETA